MRCLSHPKGRLINRRPENALDLERVFEVALEEGIALEVNGLPDRLDLSGEHVREALRADARTAGAYADLKRSLAVRLGHDRVAYTEAKSAFIEQVLEARR